MYNTIQQLVYLAKKISPLSVCLSLYAVKSIRDVSVCELHPYCKGRTSFLKVGVKIIHRIIDTLLCYVLSAHYNLFPLLKTTMFLVLGIQTSASVFWTVMLIDIYESLLGIYNTLRYILQYIVTSEYNLNVLFHMYLTSAHVYFGYVAKTKQYTINLTLFAKTTKSRKVLTYKIRTMFAHAKFKTNSVRCFLERRIGKTFQF
jgi:hypothetical protein